MRPDTLADNLAALPPDQLAYLNWQMGWIESARPLQLPPNPEDQAEWLAQNGKNVHCEAPTVPWIEMGYQAGRGFGKTRVGSEWIGNVAFTCTEGLPYAVVAPTQNDVRFTCFEGKSGLLNVIPPECVARYRGDDLLITLTNGATIRGFSAEKADRLRGPEHAAAWCMSPNSAVLMADGSLRTITQVLVGELVATRWGPRRVLAAGPSGNPNAQYQIQAVSDVDEDAILLRCTSDHPVLANDKWTPAEDLKPGDRLTVIEHVGGWAVGEYEEPNTTRWTGATVTHVINDTERYGRDRDWMPHCLTVEGVNEFIANGVVVHNCDEIAAWGKDAEYTLDMLQMGLRIGSAPRLLWTSTPKPTQIVRALTKPKPGRIIVRGATYDNRANLAATFIDNLEKYDGTKIGRQELYGELIDPEEAGIVRRSWINLWPAKSPLPRFDWIIMSLDTAYTEKTLDTKGDPDPTACGVWGIFTHKGRSCIMLLDCWEEHLGLPDLITRVKRELNTAYGQDEDQALIKPMFGSSKPLTSGRKPDILLIEDKGSGISLRQSLERANIHAYAYNPGRADKLSRLHVVSPIFAQRRVWVPESQKNPGKPRTWCEPLIGQLCSFAGDGSIKHDDHVDQTTQAMRLCLDKGLLKLVKDKPRNVDDVSPPTNPMVNPYAA